MGSCKTVMDCSSHDEDIGSARSFERVNYSGRHFRAEIASFSVCRKFSDLTLTSKLFSAFSGSHFETISEQKGQSAICGSL